jgi:hypothetical protein
MRTQLNSSLKKILCFFFGLIFQPCGHHAWLAQGHSTKGHLPLHERDLEQLQARKRPFVVIKGAEGRLFSHFGTQVSSMLIIAGAVIVKDEVEKSLVNGRNFSPIEVATLSGKIASEILFGGAAWTAMITGATAASIAGPIIGSVQPKSLSGGTFGLLRLVLAQSIAATVMMGGASAGIQLWQRAVEKLPQSQKGMGQNLLSSLVEAAHRNTWTASSAALRDHFKVFAKIVKSMGEIAIFRSDERSLWLHDTWRYEIATAPFLTSTTGMALGSALGIYLGSFGGPAGAAIGGVIGGAVGTAAMISFVPDKVSDSISDKIIHLRRIGLIESLNRCMSSIEQKARECHKSSITHLKNNFSSLFLKSLENCGVYREQILTTFMDQAKFWWERRLHAQELAKTAEKNKRISIAGDFFEKARAADLAMGKNKAMVHEFYLEQHNRFQKFHGKTKRSQCLFLLADEASRVNIVLQNISPVLDSFPENHSSLGLVLESAKNGFMETHWLNTFETTDRNKVASDSPIRPTAVGFSH